MSDIGDWLVDQCVQRKQGRRLRGGEGEGEKQTDRQTDRQIDRQTDRQTDESSDRMKNGGQYEEGR